MTKVLTAGLIAFLVVAGGIFVALGTAFESDASQAVSLREHGELVHARVVGRTNEERTVGTGAQRHVVHDISLALTGELAGGGAWSATLDTDEAGYGAHPEGTLIDVTVLTSDPELFMVTADLAARDASGHQPGEGSMRLMFSLGGGAFVALLVALVVNRRRLA